MGRSLWWMALALLPSLALAELKVGEVPPVVALAGEQGARVSGEPWRSDELKGKVHLVFYVDPDERTLNDHVANAVKAEAFDRARYGSVAILNMDATWLPNRMLESSLEKKQKEFPDTVYVKDFKKVLVQRWGLADHNNDVLLFAPDGRLLFYKAGALDADEVKTLIGLIRDNLP